MTIVLVGTTVRRPYDFCTLRLLERDMDGNVEWNVRERVHIMPVGFEFDRIVVPAEQYRADQVVLIGHEGDESGSEGEEYWNRVTAELEERDIPYNDLGCDMFDLYSSLGTIAKAITTHSDDDVYVNLSTGSKITAIAGMIASMVLDTTAYYVRALDYDDGGPTDIVDVIDLPMYPIDAPDKEQVGVLEFIEMWTEHEGPPTKGEIIHFSEQESLAYIRQNVAGKGKYRLLDTHIVEPLKERGWIDESKQGRNKVLSLTADGEAALQAFRWMVEDIDWEKYLEEGLSDEVESES